MVLKTRSCSLLTICRRSSPRDAIVGRTGGQGASLGVQCGVRWGEPKARQAPVYRERSVIGDQQIDWDETVGCQDCRQRFLRKTRLPGHAVHKAAWEGQDDSVFALKLEAAVFHKQAECCSLLLRGISATNFNPNPIRQITSPKVC
jgi:hypothetical protein